MNTPINRRRFLLGGGAGLVAFAGGTFMIRQSQAGAARWVDPMQGRQGEVTPSPTPSPTPPAFNLAADFDPKQVKITAAGWHSWALMDRKTGAIVGSTNLHETNRTCSMIKTWIAADYLRQKPNPTQARQDQIVIMIKDSDNASATVLLNEIGRQASYARVKSLVQTVDFKGHSSWGHAQISAWDTCLLADAVAGGRIANAQWTEWLLDQMRNVRRGTWGIRAAFPSAERDGIAIKNGWDITSAANTYHANCLAVTERWAMAVLTRYPVSVKANESHGATIAESIAEQLLDSSELEPLFA